MALKFENVLSGFVIFSLLVSLAYGIYNGISTEYQITPDYVDENGRNQIEALKNINVISGLSQIQNAIKSMYSSSNTGSSDYDILGLLRSGGIGVIKVGTGILTAPIEILGVVSGFYSIPSSVSISLGLIIIIYLGYMLLSELLGK